jgi:hypothetical protein
MVEKVGLTGISVFASSKMASRGSRCCSLRFSHLRSILAEFSIKNNKTAAGALGEPLRNRPEGEDMLEQLLPTKKVWGETSVVAKMATMPPASIKLCLVFLS